MTKTTQTCDCCGGKLPAKETWEANRDQAGECTGSVEPGTGRCRAFSDDDLWMDVYTVRTDAFMADDFHAESLDAAIEEAFDGEIAGVKDEESLRRKFARYERDGGWCWIECNGERVLEIGRE